MFTVGQRVIFNPGGSKWLGGDLKDAVGTIVRKGSYSTTYIIALDKAPEDNTGLSGYEPVTFSFEAYEGFIVPYNDGPAVQVKTLEAFI